MRAGVREGGGGGSQGWGGGGGGEWVGVRMGVGVTDWIPLREAAESGTSPTNSSLFTM